MCKSEHLIFFYSNNIKLEDIVPCFNFLIGLIPDSAAAKMMDPKVVRRALRVVHCLEERTQELIGASQVVIDGNEYHSSFMSNTLIKLQAMKQMLNSPAED